MTYKENCMVWLNNKRPRSIKTTFGFLLNACVCKQRMHIHEHNLYEILKLVILRYATSFCCRSFICVYNHELKHDDFVFILFDWLIHSVTLGPSNDAYSKRLVHIFWKNHSFDVMHFYIFHGNVFQENLSKI